MSKAEDRYGCYHDAETEAAEEVRRCPYCDEVGGEPTQVEVRDDSVRYWEFEERCSFCV